VVTLPGLEPGLPP